MPLILLSEDDVSVRSVINCMLSADGHEVVCVGNGYDAIDQLLKIGIRFDLLVTDLNMPGMDGQDLTYAAKILCPELPVVMISGDRMAKNSLKYAGHLVAAFIEKPISIRKLCNLIREITLEKRDTSPKT